MIDHTLKIRNKWKQEFTEGTTQLQLKDWLIEKINDINKLFIIDLNLIKKDIINHNIIPDSSSIMDILENRYKIKSKILNMFNEE